jgi:hypothetical protein
MICWLPKLDFPRKKNLKMRKKDARLIRENFQKLLGKNPKTKFSKIT